MKRPNQSFPIALKDSNRISKWKLRFIRHEYSMHKKALSNNFVILDFSFSFYVFYKNFITIVFESNVFRIITRVASVFEFLCSKKESEIIFLCRK